MIKMVVQVFRKPELSAEEFKRYWIDVHGPLVKRVAPILRIKRYIQSHNLHSEEVAVFNKMRGWPGACEALAEVWWDSEAEMRAGMSSPESVAAQRELAEDEARFCDMTRMGAFLSSEVIILDET